MAKLFKKFSMIFLLAICAFVFVACGDDPTPGPGPEVKPEETVKEYTYLTYTTLSPSNWNELTYQDNNDTQIMNYLMSPLFEFDFKFDADGEIVDGDFTVKYAAATKLEDVTADYVGEKWGIAEGASAQAYKITLRQDLAWENGDPIDANDFVYTMKEQLNPLFQHYRADSFYVGGTVIHNAEKYVKQGQSGRFAGTAWGTYSAELDSKLFFKLAPSSEAENVQAYFRDSMGFPASYDAAATAAYIKNGYLADNAAFDLAVVASMEGKTLAEIKADAAMKAAWDALIGWWQTEPNEELHFFVTDYTYPEMTFDQVGFFAASDYELVLVLDKPLALLNEDGSLSYKAAYNMSGLPLVKEDLYESCKIAPVGDATLWTTNYNTSKETSASWGPYKLESFQNGKEYVLVKNEKWFGFTANLYEGQYQTTKVKCETIEEWNTAWLKFKAGEIDGIGIDVSIADDYKASERAYYTPDDFVASLQLQSNKEALKSRETEGYNKTIMAYADFRKALSLSIDRADFAAKTTTSSLAGFGIFNSMHYYDVANGKTYRGTDAAKKVLCEVYAVDWTQFDNLDDAVDSITGYNLEEARALLTKAYNDALTAGDIKATDKVAIELGTGAINEVVTRRFDYIKESWNKLAETTPLEGKFEFTVTDKGASWANDFRAGGYDVCMGGWSGAAWDPGYFLLAYLDPGYMYSKAWATDTITLEFTMPGVGENGADVTDTLTLLEWYDCLNGGGKYDWYEGALENDKRVLLIAALEKEILSVYYSVPLYNSFAASLLSYKVDYVTYTYNTFMGYGGIQYMTYNYTDAEWTAYVASQNGEINYKK